MFSKGVLKIFIPPKPFAKREDLFNFAKEAGFSALLCNGIVYVLSKGHWHETSFILDDFSDDHSK